MRDSAEVVLITTESLVDRLFHQPTAPFREQFVLDESRRIAKEAKLPFCEDRFGNLIVGVSNLKDLNTGSRLLLFAHTDHPGFLISNQDSEETADAIWLGGGPFAEMLGAKVRIYNPINSKSKILGTITDFQTGPYQVKGLKMKIRLQKPQILAPGSFGAFAQPELKIRNSQLVSRVADDLAGCVMALGAAMDVKPKGKVVAVLTRAEEVGLVGCLALLKAQKFSKNSICVSLEASRELPGAQLGEGPVLRLGDRATLFDNLSSQFMWVIAQEQQKKSGIKFQRRIMDGGRCEASAMSLYGLRTTGLAVPLRNYHNQGKRGPAPEIIDMRDLKNGRIILTEMGRQLSRFKNLEKEMKKSIDTAFHALAPHLQKREWS